MEHSPIIEDKVQKHLAEATRLLRSPMLNASTWAMVIEAIAHAIEMDFNKERNRSKNDKILSENDIPKMLGNFDFHDPFLNNIFELTAKLIITYFAENHQSATIENILHFIENFFNEETIDRSSSYQAFINYCSSNPIKGTETLEYFVSNDPERLRPMLRILQYNMHEQLKKKGCSI